MTNNKFADHPIEVLLNLCRTFPEIRKVSFSRYEAAPAGIQSAREDFTVTRQDVTYDWFDRILAELPNNYELALCSKVYTNEGIYHIPMIDFFGRHDGSRFIKCCSTAMPAGSRHYVFSTGRSFHAYGIALLSNEAWGHYLGNLLLCNPARVSPIVDWRWVGHSLQRGYSALRWSKNTNRYLMFPIHQSNALDTGNPYIPLPTVTSLGNTQIESKAKTIPFSTADAGKIPRLSQGKSGPGSRKADQR